MIKLPFLSKKTSPAKELTVQELLPFSGIEKNTLRMKNGSLRVMTEVTNLINTNLMDEEELEIVLEGLQSTLNGFQGKRFQMFVSSEAMDIDEFVRTLDQKIEQEDESAFRLERLDAERKFVIEHTNHNRFTKSFYLITGSNQKSDEDKMEDLRLRTKELADGINTTGLGNSTLQLRFTSGIEYGRVLFDKLNPRMSRTQGTLESYGLDDLAPHPMWDRDTYYEIDGHFYHVLAIKTFPRDPDPCWIQKLFDIKGHLDILIDIQSSGKSKEKLIKNISDSMGEIRDDLERDLSDAEKKRKQQDLKDADMVLDELIGDDEEAFLVSVFLLVREESYEKLEKLTKEAETRLRKLKASAFRLEYEGFDGLFAALPIMHESNLYKRFGNPMHSKAISGMYPFVRTDFQMTTGIRRGYNVENKSLVIVDRMDRKKFVNGNEITIGMSGVGKTSAAEMDILREHSQGFKIRVVTPEPGFEFPYGKHLNISPAAEWVFNPFHISSYVVDKDEGEEDILHPGEYLRLKVSHIMRWFQWVLPALDDFERAKLHQAVVKTYKGVEYTFTSEEPPTKFPILEDLVKIIAEDPEMKRVKVLLDPFVDGAFAKMFNGQRNWEMGDLFVANVRDVPLEILPGTMELLIQEIWEDIKRKAAIVGMYIDELWYFGDEKRPQTLDFIFEIYKRIRKYTGYANSMTQNVPDLLGHPKLKAIFNNAVFHRYFPMRYEDVDALSKVVPLTKKEISFLQSQKEPQGTNLFVIGDHRMKTRTDYNLDELRILDPKKFELLEKVSVG